MIRALLVDDEEPARDRLRALLGHFEDIVVVDEASDGDEAVEKITKVQPDLVFLDIQMPGRSGMEVATSLAPPRPAIIFCTAFDQYAIDAFEHHAADYLLKPVSKKRLGRAIDRVRGQLVNSAVPVREVVEATRTQERLLPQSLPPMSHLDYAGHCRAARGVGGDYYDFLALGPGKLGIAVGDVSGKGLFAGLLVAGLQARVQAIASAHVNSLGNLVGQVNKSLQAGLESNRYATFFFAIFDDAARKLRYVNAGHNPPLLYRAATGQLERLEANGTVIGLLPEATYEERTVDLGPGDVLVAYSDGLPEARNGGDEEFGEPRIERVLLEHAALDAAPLSEAMLREVNGFVGDLPQQDDLTLVVARGR